MQVRYWSNSVTLFEHALDVTVDNSMAHLNLGEALAEQGKINAAVRHYYEALRIKPGLVAPHLNLGVALKEEGKLNEAIDHFSTALRLKPDCAEAQYELGDTLSKKGDFAGAVEHYHEAVRIKPDYAKVYNNLGVILARQKKIKKLFFIFIRHFKSTLLIRVRITTWGKFLPIREKLKMQSLITEKHCILIPTYTSPL